MKIQFLLFAILLHSSSNLWAQPTICNADSTISFRSTSASDSVFSSKNTFIYSNSNNLLESNFFSYTSSISGWRLLRKRTQEFNSANRRTLLREANLNNATNALEIDFETYEYPTSGSLIRLDSVINLTKMNNGLAPFSKETYNYDTNEKLLNSTLFQFDDVSGLFVATRRREYRYRLNGKSDSLLVYEIPSGTLLTTTAFEYNSMDSLQSVHLFNNSTNTPISKYEYEYSINPSATKETYYTFANGWNFQNSRKSIYNPQSQLVELESIFANSAQSSKIFYEFLPNSDCRYRALLYRTTDNITWTEFGPLYYYYPNTVGISTPDDQSILQLVTPNPFSDKINFQTESTCTITVQNAAGILVQQLHALEGQEIELDTQKWANGIYILTASNVHGISSVKLLKL